MSEKTRLRSNQSGEPLSPRSGAWPRACAVMSLLVALASLLVIISLRSPRVTSIDKPPEDAPGPGCDTDQCHRMSEWMNPAIDPCEDFYEFACGNWSSLYPAQAGAQHWTNFVRLNKDNQELVKAVIGGKNRGKYKYKWMTKVRNYYGQCRKRDNETLKKTRKFTLRLLKKFPVKLKPSNGGNRKRLAKLLANIFQNFGVDTLFHFHIGINDKNSSQHIVKIDQPSLTFSNKEDYVHKNLTQKKTHRRALYNYMKNVKSLIFKNKVKKSGLNDLVNFEFKLGSSELSVG